MGSICRGVGGHRGKNGCTCLQLQCMRCMTMPFRLFRSILVPILRMSCSQVSYLAGRGAYFIPNLNLARLEGHVRSDRPKG